MATERAQSFRYLVVAALASVIGAAVVGIGYAAAGPSASAQQYEYGQKVTICHHTGSRTNPHKTITVSRNAVPAHMRHGDTVGPCPTVQGQSVHSSTTHVRRFHRGVTLRAELASEQKAAKAKAEKAAKAKAEKAEKAKAEKSKAEKDKGDKGKGDKGKGKGKP